MSEPTPKFVAGDKVLVNGNLVATIKVYDTDANQLVLESIPTGGGTDTIYGHVTSYQLEHLVTEAIGSPDPIPADEAKHAKGAE